MLEVEQLEVNKVFMRSVLVSKQGTLIARAYVIKKKGFITHTPLRYMLTTCEDVNADYQLVKLKLSRVRKLYLIAK